MAKNQIGTCVCPDCSFPDAEVALDKKGNPYRVCVLGECDGAQHFTHGKPGRVKNLLTKTKALPGKDLHEIAAKFGVKLPGPAPAADPRPAGDPAPAVKKSGITLF